jgi:hypothetical protein
MRGTSRHALPAAGLAAVMTLATACSAAGQHGGGQHGGGQTPVATPACRPGVNAAEYWLIGGHALATLRAGTMRHAIKPANLLVLEPPGGTSTVGQTVADFKSYAAFHAAVEAGTIPPTTHWVMYDNERWPGTPAAEQRAPGHYETLFAKLARSHRYRVILAPAQDLVRGFSRSRFRGGRPAWSQYLSMRLAATSARLATIYEIQAQPYELSTYRGQGTYARFVQAAVSQARAASPDVVIFAGLSTQRVTGPAELLSDFLAVRGLVAGYWLNIPGYHTASQPAIAGSFLNSLPAPATAAGRSCTAR